MTERIYKTEEFLRAKLAESPYFKKFPEAGEYRLAHSIRVARLAGEIARAEGMDEEAMIIAGLLHDVSYCAEFDENGWKDHGRASARIAEPFLREIGLEEMTIREICFGIAIHVDGKADFDGERTAFALTIGDADNIDRFDAYRLYETLENVGFHRLSMPQKRAHVKKTLKRMEEFAQMQLATAAATALWRGRIEAYRDFYKRLAAQLARSVSYLPQDESASDPAPEANEKLLGLAGHF